MGKTVIPAVPLRTPTHTGDPTKAALSRPWTTFFEQLVGALSGLGGLADQHNSAISFWVSGTLAIGSDLAPRVAPLSSVTAAAVTALVKTAPTGADLTFALSYFKGSVWTTWMTLTIPATNSSVTATGAQLTAASALPAGAPIRLDVTGCGTTFPGADLSVFVYF